MDARWGRRAGGGWAMLLVALGALEALAADRPNIVLMVVDDMGVMDCSVPMLTDPSGKPQRYPLNDRYRTPHLEMLAARGIRLSNFHAMSVCSPTRLTIMTGQNAARHRTTNWINPDRNNGGPHGPADWGWRGLDRSSVTLPRLLQSAGYRTIHVGKGHFGPRDSEGAEPRNLGFDENIAGASFGAPGSYYGEQNFGWGTQRQFHAVPHLEKYHGSGTFLTEALTLEAVSRLEAAAASGQPFLLHLAHYAVHAPFEPDPRFVDHYAGLGLPADALAFATLIEGVDKSLGDVLTALERLGMADNTLVIFVGDNGSDAPLGDPHGVSSSAPLRGKKGSHYEGGTRVPMVAAWARPSQLSQTQRRLPIASGAVQTQLATIEDLFPTLLDLAGVSPPHDHPVDGYRLKRLLSGQPDPDRPAQFLMHYPHAPHRSDYFTVWRDGRWKVVYHYFPGEGAQPRRYQLFDLEADPLEQSDLAEARPEQVARLMRGMIQRLDLSRAVYPTDPETQQPLVPRMP